MKAGAMFFKTGRWEGKLPEDKCRRLTCQTLRKASHSSVCPGRVCYFLSVQVSSSFSPFGLERHTFKMFYFFTRIVVKQILALKLFIRSYRYYLCI